MSVLFRTQEPAIRDSKNKHLSPGISSKTAEKEHGLQMCCRSYFPRKSFQSCFRRIFSPNSLTTVIKGLWYTRPCADLRRRGLQEGQRWEEVVPLQKNKHIYLITGCGLTKECADPSVSTEKGALSPGIRGNVIHHLGKNSMAGAQSLHAVFLSMIQFLTHQSTAR